MVIFFGSKWSLYISNHLLGMIIYRCSWWQSFAAFVPLFSNRHCNISWIISHLGMYSMTTFRKLSSFRNLCCLWYFHVRVLIYCSQTRSITIKCEIEKNINSSQYKIFDLITECNYKLGFSAILIMILPPFYSFYHIKPSSTIFYGYVKHTNIDSVYCSNTRHRRSGLLRNAPKWCPPFFFFFGRRRSRTFRKKTRKPSN